MGGASRERATLEIGQRIITGELAVGARLDEDALARELAEDPMIVRDALCFLRRDGFVRDADAAGYAAGQIVLGSFHIMGTARMAGHPTLGACDPTGQTYDVRNVVVCDGSTFPTSSGVNPQISIMAIAWMNASALAARLS